MANTQEQIEQVCQKFKEYSCLLSIPGFGPTLSAMVLGAIGNPWRFQKAVFKGKQRKRTLIVKNTLSYCRAGP
jgi:hypothetical protein